jgi:hypothetical protein
MKREQLRRRLWIRLANNLMVSSKINCFLLDLGSTQIELEHETESCNADSIIYITKKSDWVTATWVAAEGGQYFLTNVLFASNQLTFYLFPAIWEWRHIYLL